MTHRIAKAEVSLVLMACIFASSLLFSQEEISVSIEPKLPVAGGEFIVFVEIPDVDPLSVTVPDPVTEEGLRFLGVDIRPAGTESLRGSSLAFRFLSLKSGRWEITDLEVSIEGKKRILGSWGIDVQETPGKPVLPQHASWSAPDSVWQFQQFTARALDAEGKALDLPGVPGMESASTEMAADGKTLLIASRQSCVLPATTISVPGKKYKLEAKKISVRTLPVSAGEVFGVGVFKSAIEAQSLTAEVGDFIPFSTRVDGPGMPVRLQMPAVSMAREDRLGQVKAVAMEEPTKPVVTMSVRGSSWFCTVTSRGGFYAAKEGVYHLRMEPCRFFDPVAGIAKTTELCKVSITVKAKKTAAPEVDRAFLAKLDSALSEFAKKNPGWDECARLLGEGNYAKALESAPFAAASLKTLPGKEQEIFASLLLVNGNIAELNVLLLPLERGFWPRPEVSRLLDAAAAGSGFPRRPQHLFYAPGIFFALASLILVALAIASLIALLGRINGKTASGRGKAGVIILLLALALLCTICGLLAMAERSRPLFMTSGSIVHIVPSALSTVSFVAPPGFTGRVRKAVSPWFFAEFSDGRNGWLLEQDVIFY